MKLVLTVGISSLVLRGRIDMLPNTRLAWSLKAGVIRRGENTKIATPLLETPMIAHQKIAKIFKKKKNKSIQKCLL
jgi:hypothetical protein